MRNNNAVMEASPKSIDEAEDEEECVEASSSAADKDCKGSWNNKCSLQFTAMEELMICKAYIKASKDSIHGSKQKIVLFKVQLLMAYNGIKREQEEEDACNAAKPLHLKPSGCSITAVLYPECTASSIHQHITKKVSPAVIKYMSVVKQVSIYF